MVDLFGDLEAQVMGINMVALCEGLSVGQKAGLSGKDILEAPADYGGWPAEFADFAGNWRWP